MVSKDLIDILVAKDIDPTLSLPDPSLLQYYNDFANRIIWLDSEVNSEYLDIISKIIYWNREDKNIPIEERKPIKIYFLSPGGDLEIEEAIVSTIRLSKTPVWGIGMGMVASAASLIYLSCSKRYALPNTYFIFHQGSCTNMSGSYDAVQSAMEDYKRSVEKLTVFYIENTDYTEEEVRNKITHDWYIYLEEAKEKHIITDIVENIDDIL